MSSKNLAMLEDLITADERSLKLMVQAMTCRDYKMLVYFLQGLLKAKYSSLLHVLLLPRPYLDFARRVCECKSSVRGRKMLLREGTPDGLRRLLTPILSFLVDASGKKSQAGGPLRWVRKEVKCPICSKVFRRRDHLKKHQNLHVSYDDMPFVCPVCRKRFCSSDAVRKHTTHRCYAPSPLIDQTARESHSD